MRVIQMTAERFRNLQSVCLQPAPDCNVIVGENAQGKTNILEAIWLFTGGKSFRGAKDGEMVAFDQPDALLQMDFFAAGREQTAQVRIDKGRSVCLNGLEWTSPAKLAGHFCGIVFSPTHLQLIKDGPEQRRRFLDAAYCQVRPAYLSALATYLHILRQRNTLLKDCRGHRDLEDLLQVFTEKLVSAAAQVWAARTDYVRQLAPLAAEIYGGISGQREKMTVTYDGTVDLSGEPSAWPEKLQAALEQAWQQDIVMGCTTVGPHRDDLRIEIDGKPARAYGSQGQQRSAVLALKLAEASLLRQATQEQPIALLDDVMSELDPSRQEYVLNHIRDWQVFITCCDPSALLRMKSGKQFHMERGTLKEG